MSPELLSWLTQQRDRAVGRAKHCRDYLALPAEDRGDGQGSERYEEWARESEELAAWLTEQIAESEGLTLRRLQAINAERARRWHADGLRPWSVLEWAGAMCGEAGEAANVAKKLLRIDLELPGNAQAEHAIVHRPALLEKLAGELAGVVLYCALVAEDQGIDFEQAVIAEFDTKSAAMGFPERLG